MKNRFISSTTPSLYYMATRDDSVSRADLRDALQDYMQERLNDIAALETPDDRFADMVSDEWLAFQRLDRMIQDVFGFRAVWDGATKVTVEDMG